MCRNTQTKTGLNVTLGLALALNNWPQELLYVRLLSLDSEMVIPGDLIRETLNVQNFEGFYPPTNFENVPTSLTVGSKSSRKFSLKPL